MTAPPTPNLGPLPEGRRRGGSVSGGPWQLIEVSNAKAAAVLSTPASPNLPILRTPSTVGYAAQPPPADIDLEDWTIGEAALPFEEEKEEPPEETWEDAPPPRATTEADGFDPMCLVGDWMDSLGHRISVSPTQSGGRRRGRRQGNRGGNRLVFLAVLQKYGVPDKRFNISKDRGKKEWVCGNGVLVRDETSMESIVWLAADGRKSNWTRLPPEGPVYFDAPPSAMMASEEDWTQAPHGGSVYFVVHDAVAPPQGEWKALRLPDDEDDSAAAAAEAVDAAVAVDDGDAVAAAPASNKWNLAAAEFVPRSFALSGNGVSTSVPMSGNGVSVSVAVESVPAAPDTSESEAEAVPNSSPEVAPHKSPESAPRKSPLLAPDDPARLSFAQRKALFEKRQAGSASVSPEKSSRRSSDGSEDPAAGDPTTVRLSEQSPDLHVAGSRLEWLLPDNWGKLSNYPKGFCLTSPMFEVRQAANMQLVFYPNGSRTAEPGHCTLALTRGPDSAGIKFNFAVNGRDSGPKVCLGRRYLGDYPKPYDDSEESKSQKVAVSMQVMDVLGISA